MKRDVFIMQELGVIQGDFLWGMARDNKLYKTHLKTGEMEFVQKCGKPGDKEYLFNNIFACGDRIILLPGDSEFICVYHTDTGDIEEYDFADSGGGYRRGAGFCKFSCGIIYGDFLFAFPANMKYILKLNLNTMEREYINEPIKEYIDRYGSYEDMFTSTYGLAGEEIYVSCCGQNLMLRMNLHTLEYKWQELENTSDKKGYISCCANKECFFTVTIEGKVLCYDLKTLHLQKVFEFGRLGNVYCCGKFLWYVSLDKSKICSLIYGTEDVTEHDYDSRFRFSPKFEEEHHTFTRALPYHGHLCIVPRCCNGILTLDGERGSVSFLKTSFKVTPPYLRQFAQHGGQGKIYSEWEYGLPLFINNAGKGSCRGKNKKRVGENIFQLLLEEDEM